MIDQVNVLIGRKSVCILGFGAEGQSTFRLLSKFLPLSQITVVDKNPAVSSHPLLSDSKVNIIAGADYLKNLSTYGLIIKTPGLPFAMLEGIPEEKITSQTEIFIQLFSRQTIGITGTKGKSTTSSLIAHIIRQHTKNVILVGNIGVPPFDLLDQIDAHTRIVYELSSHQLEHIRYAPHTALLLNLFEEHLDHYHSKDAYFRAKLNIGLKQSKEDLFLYHADDARIMGYLQDASIHSNVVAIAFEEQQGSCCFLSQGDAVLRTAGRADMAYPIQELSTLQGKHNRLNIMFAIAACAMNGIPDDAILRGIQSFKPLAHRMEYVGCFGGLHYYNDSIATIPEATMAAVAAIPNIGTLILGGFDRGIDYTSLAEFLKGTAIDNLIFMGDAGSRILALLQGTTQLDKGLFTAVDMEEAMVVAKKYTAPGKAILLSPAAASYDRFRNFEERGTAFMQLASS